MQRKYTSLSYTEESVADGNFDSSRKPITKIVIHTTVGTKEGAIARFGKVGSNVSAHYLVTWEGKLIAFLEEYNVAYHCGNYSVNQESIGIEHEDKGNYTAVRPDALYETSAKLVADICRFYSIPCDRQHILKHNEVVATGCPHNLDIERIVKRASELLGTVGTIQVGAKDFENLVNKSTKWDSIAKYLELTSDPLIASFEDAQRVVAGYKSRITDLQTQLGNCQAELKNREEQVSRLKDQLTDSEKLRQDAIDKLNKTVSEQQGVVGVYENKLKASIDRENALAAEKGELNKALATCKAQNPVEDLTVADVIVLLFNKLKQVKLK